MYRCDRRCDGCDEKFENLVGTKHIHDNTFEIIEYLNHLKSDTPSGVTDLSVLRRVLNHTKSDTPSDATGLHVTALRHTPY